MSTGEIIGTILLVALILACIPGVIVTSIGRKRTRIEDEEGDEEDIYAYLESYVEETPEPAENPEPEQNPEPESQKPRNQNRTDFPPLI